MKSTLKKLIFIARLGAAGALPAFSGAAQAQTCAPQSEAMAGLYTLTGVREVGSQILLRPQGVFQYMLAYGAVDEAAEGCWRRENDAIILRVNRMAVSKGGQRFQTLRLAILPDGGLQRIFSAQHKGVYRRRK